jgi:hypothetical protein
MRKLLSQKLLWFTTIAALVAGCSSAPPAAQGDPAMDRLRAVATLFRQWTELHQGTPPANQDQFIAFIQQQDPSKWTQVAGTPQELLTSPRDNQPFALALGAPLKDSAETGFPWVAREKSGVDGKVYVVDLRGRIQSLDAQEIAKSFPSPR